MTKVAFFGQTDVGRVRTNNEDAFLVRGIWDDRHVLAVVIDGVGGYEGGEVAAAIARDSILDFLQNHPSGDSLGLLKKAVTYANNMIYREREAKPELSSMSCVLTAALVELDKMRVNVAHVGDTRLYQYASDRMEKLSHDHSLVGYREEIGDLTEEEAMNHPQRNIISRDVGSCMLDDNDTSYVEVASYPLEAKSQLLLCSDGLCDMVTSNEMAYILSQNITVEEKVAELIDAALAHGGKDNVTVVLVDIESDEVDAELPPVEVEMELECPCMPDSSEPAPTRRSGWLALGFMLAFVAGAAAGFFARPLVMHERQVENKESVDLPKEVDDTTRSGKSTELESVSGMGDGYDNIDDDITDEGNQGDQTPVQPQGQNGNG